MVQIRNVPPELHRRLKARAAIEGMSMTDYVLRELRKALERPTRQEVLDRLRERPPGWPPTSARWTNWTSWTARAGRVSAPQSYVHQVYLSSGLHE